MRTYLVFFLLSLSFISPVFGQSPKIKYSSGGKYSLDKEPELIPHAKAEKDPYWKYFWEFGDGHFSFDKSPKHEYKHDKMFPVRLHMTPYYASNKPTVVTHLETKPKVGIPGTEKMKGNISIQSSANPGKNDADVMPGSSYEIVVQVKAPSDMTQNGYLFIFYNKLGEVATVPFKKIVDQRPYINGKNVPNAKSVANGPVPGKIKNLKNKFQDLIAFEAFKIMDGEQRNFFFTLKTNQALDKYQDQDQNISVTAVWLPNGMNNDQGMATADYKMEILAIHDPNRLVAKNDKPYFRKNAPQEIDYVLQFQNEATGTVNKVTATIQVGKGVDVHSVKNIKPDIENFPPCNGNTNRPCYEVKPVPEKDQFIMTFYEMGLEGKDSKKLLESKKSTKAKIKFSINGSNKREKRTKAFADIKFDNVADVRTNNDKLKWRMKSIYVHGGINENVSANTYTVGSGTEESNKRSWSLGIGLQNAPLGNGWTRNLEFNVSSFEIYKESLQNLSEINGEKRDFLYTKERLDTKVFDVRYGLGYQLSGNLKAYAAAGIVLPAWGKVNMEGWFDPYFETGIEPTIEDIDELEFAAWQKNDPVQFMGQEADAPYMIPGFSGKVGVEFGWLNDVSIGASYEYRRLHKSYNDECLGISNINIYAKLKLFRI